VFSEIVQMGYLSHIVWFCFNSY